MHHVAVMRATDDLLTYLLLIFGPLPLSSYRQSTVWMKRGDSDSEKTRNSLFAVSGC
jgi:hypothetical protein